MKYPFQMVHKHMNDTVMMKVSMGPVLSFELFKRIALNALFLSLCITVVAANTTAGCWSRRQTPTLHCTFHWRWNFNETQHVTRHDTKRKNNRIVHGLFIRSSKINFSNCGIELLKNEKFQQRQQPKSTSTLNLKICVSTAEKFPFLLSSSSNTKESRLDFNAIC